MTKTYLETVSNTISKLFENDEKLIYLGEDVRNGHKGISPGYVNKFGLKRIIDMPISESSFVSFAVGLASCGYKPFVEFNFSGLSYVCLDQIYNQACKFKTMTGNVKSIPIKFILPTGTKGGLAGHHSDNPYSIFANLGIRTIMPGTATEVEKCLTHFNNYSDPIAFFLPVQEFRNIINLENDNLEYIGYQCINKSINNTTVIICTGTTLSLSIEYNNYLISQNYNGIDIYCISDLNFTTNVVELLSGLIYENIILIDDSNIDFGIIDKMELLILKSDNKYSKIFKIGRSSDTIPFKAELENKIRPVISKLINLGIYHV